MCKLYKLWLECLLIEKKTRTSYVKLKEILPKEMLYTLFWEENLTYKKISKIYKVGEHQISKLAKGYNIKINNLNIRQIRNKDNIKIFNEKELIDLYCNQKLSLRQIAKIKNTTHGILSKKLKQIGIEIRSANDKLYYTRKNTYIDGDYYISDNGYLKLGDEYVHRIIMSKHLNRELDSEEYVHHIDFDKLNNDINNLFLFPSDNLHIFYHGYIKDSDYILPEDYLIYYEQNLKNTYDNYNWLYNEYINKKLSCNGISKKLKISRLAVTNRLKMLKIYNLRNPTINQYI